MNFNKSLIISFLITVALASSSLYAGTWKSGSSFSINGYREYKVYIPSGLTKTHKAHLVVMLHGCEQSAEDFGKGTRISEWAEKEKFVALLPEQNTLYNPFKCWNWVMPYNNLRGGEPAAIIEMMDAVTNDYNLDKENVYAAGMSAGASMVNILGNCYPERFKALGSQDGTQYYASSTGIDFSDVVLKGASVPSAVAAKTGYNCSAGVTKRPAIMPIIIFAGMNSPLMSPIHASQVEDEFKIFNDYLDNGVKDNSYFKANEVLKVQETNTYGYSLYKTVNKQNVVFIERYMIEKLGHDWSGGISDLEYNDPLGPDATALMVKFFKRFGL
ncbi:MAG: PHB depolymerase family esterase [Bacteriovorax sp.]|nr:PHB depolymerase family esterase [Bacteriovorax sp.]